MNCYPILVVFHCHPKMVAYFGAQQFLYTRLHVSPEIIHLGPCQLNLLLSCLCMCSCVFPMLVFITHFPQAKPMFPQLAYNQYLPFLSRATFLLGHVELGGVIIILYCTPFFAKSTQDNMAPSNEVLLTDQGAEIRVVQVGIKLEGIRWFRQTKPRCQCLN